MAKNMSISNLAKSSLLSKDSYPFEEELLIPLCKIPAMSSKSPGYRRTSDVGIH